jgi:hypothetical protein
MAGGVRGRLALVMVLAGAVAAATGTRGQREYRGEWEFLLHSADQMYSEGDYGGALHSYRRVRALRADLWNDDVTCWRIAGCSEKFIGCLSRLLPANMEAEQVYGHKLMKWLRQNYGYYIEISEGDSCWIYDRRALRELITRHPRSELADDAMYELVKYQLIHEEGSPSDMIAGWPTMAEVVRKAIERYRGILARYPKTNLKDRIVSNIEAMKAYLASKGGIALPEEWHYG